MSANSPDTPRTVEVVLVKSGRTIRHPAEPLADDGIRVTVRAPWAGEGVRDFGFVRFEPGDASHQMTAGPPYVVKEVRDAEGVRKGWYCDITRPATLSGGELVVEDLDLDLWRSADGTDVLRLDEDEFAASGLATTDPRAATAAQNALDTLELLAREGDFEALIG